MAVRRSPVPWFGGKAKMVGHLMMLMPEHQHYVEPFGGGASLLLRKEPPGGVETYNDVDQGLVSFFRALADPELCPRLCAKLALWPHARTLYNEYREDWQESSDPVERAARWFYVARLSFSGTWGGSWGTSVATSISGMGSQNARWIHSVDRLPEIHARLRQVQIECADWRTVLARYQGPGYLAYCDPPYVLSTRRAGRYQHELTDDDHRDLVAALLQYQGAVMLSGYRCELYRPLEEAGWRRSDITVPCSAAGRTRGTGILGWGGAAHQRRVESVWLNPEAVRRHGPEYERVAARLAELRAHRERDASSE
jgi:DNA adenine methylase